MKMSGMEVQGREGRTQIQNFKNQKGLFQMQNKGKARTEGAAEPDIKKLNWEQTKQDYGL